MTYEETLAWMHSMPRIHREPTIKRMQRLLDLLGNPEKKLAGRFLHVTGTNGKGSICAFLTAALQAQGYRVGRFISPFIMDFCERMELGGEPIAKETVAALGEEVRGAVAILEKETGELPLEFELVTAMGLLWFAKEGCDLVVLEVGIGGISDATNVVTPLLSIIARIDLDHTELLGETHAEIAACKSGIIKEGAPCVLYHEQEPEVFPVIRRKCEETHSRLVIPDGDGVRVLSACPGKLSFSYQDVVYTLQLSGLYQVRNALCAIEALHLLPALGFPMTEEAIVRGLSAAHFPARFEVLSEQPMVILDGAHNRSGMEALRENMDFYFQDRPMLCLCGMLKDKTPADALAPVLSRGNIVSVACITPPSPRAMTADALSEIFRAYGIPAKGYADAAEAWEALKEKALADGLPVLCFGSLYLAGDVRRLFGETHE